jgi:glyoxylase-like metal-dependent hydrolase (beta-lactamase superfamily II)
VPEAQVEIFRERGNHYRRLVPSVTPHFRAVRDGDVLTIGDHVWHAFTVLGHAPEHACLFCPEANLLISGDQVLPKITTNVSVWPDQPRANPLRLYLDSLRRFRPLPDGALVLPSHGLPFKGLQRRLDQLRHHHDERLAQTLDALTEPRSASELLPVLFRRRLDTHQLGFAVGETLAHVHYLEADGQAIRLVGDDGIHRFRKA